MNQNLNSTTLASPNSIHLLPTLEIHLISSYYYFLILTHLQGTPKLGKKIVPNPRIFSNNCVVGKHLLEGLDEIFWRGELWST